MSDFTFDQLRMLILQMEKNLSETKGDQNIKKELTELRKTAKDIQRQLKNNSADKKKDINYFISEFVKKVDVASRKSGGEQNIRQTSSSRNTTRESEKINVSYSEIAQKKASRDLDRRMGLFGNSLGKSSKELDLFSYAFNRNTRRLLAGIGLGYGSSRILTSAVDEQINSFRSLINSAEGSIDGILTMRESAHAAGMTITDMAKAMESGSNAARIFGAKDFATLTKNVRNATREFGFYGYSLDQLQGIQDSYLETLRKRGEITQVDMSSSTQGINEIAKSNTVIAKLMGLNRDELVKANAAANVDANFGVFMRDKFDASQQQIIATFLSTLDDATRRQFQERMLTGGSLLTQESSQLAALTPQLSETIRVFSQRLSSGEDLTTTISQFGDQMRKGARADLGGRGESQRRAIMGTVMGGAFEQANQSLLTAMGMATEKQIRESQKVLEKTGKGIEGTGLLLEETIKNVNVASRSLVDKLLKPVLEQFGTTTNELITRLNEMSRGFSGWSSNIISTVLSKTNNILEPFGVTIQSLNEMTGGSLSLFGNLGIVIAALYVKVKAALLGLTLLGNAGKVIGGSFKLIFGLSGLLAKGITTGVMSMFPRIGKAIAGLFGGGGAVFNLLKNSLPKVGGITSQISGAVAGKSLGRRALSGAKAIGKRMPLIGAGFGVYEGATSGDELRKSMGDGFGVGDRINYGIGSILNSFDDLQAMVTGKDLISSPVDFAMKMRDFDDYVHNNFGALGRLISGGDGNLAKIKENSIVQQSSGMDKIGIERVGESMAEKQEQTNTSLKRMTDLTQMHLDATQQSMNLNKQLLEELVKVNKESSKGIRDIKGF